MEDDMSIKRPFTREQRTTIIYGMLAFILILVILQLWLLTATMNAYLGGDEGGHLAGGGRKHLLPAAQRRAAAIPLLHRAGAAVTTSVAYRADCSDAPALTR